MGHDDSAVIAGWIALAIAIVSLSCLAGHGCSVVQGRTEREARACIEAGGAYVHGSCVGGLRCEPE